MRPLIITCLLGSVALLLAGCAGVATAGPAQPKTADRPPGPAAEPPSGSDFVFEGLDDRASRRAFYTAPPVVPHAIGNSTRECIACHQQERDLLGSRSMISPHAQWANCLQCHVRGQSDVLAEISATVATDWRGLAEPRAGQRNHPYAPPTVPHRLFLREDCATCHSSSHPDEDLRVDHSDRANCLQCHVPEADAQTFRVDLSHP